MPERTLAARRLVNLLDVTSGWPYHSVFTGPSGDLVVVSNGERGVLRLYHYLPDREVELIRLPQVEWAPVSVQPMPHGNWLLVDSRAVKESDHNAFVYSGDGRLLRSFHAGDTIEDVQATSDGFIWISYFDEGTTGDNPLSISGLVCLAEDGSPVFRYLDHAVDETVPPIYDCYALNVVSPTETWVYYYSDFPLVQILNRRFCQVWQDLPVHGAKSFAVGPTRALLIGGHYQDRSYKGPPASTPLVSSPAPSSGALVDLQSMRSERVQLVGEGGEPLRFDAVLGRGSHLYLSTGSTLHVIDVSSPID